MLRTLTSDYYLNVSAWNPEIVIFLPAKLFVKSSSSSQKNLQPYITIAGKVPTVLSGLIDTRWRQNSNFARIPLKLLNTTLLFIYLYVKFQVLTAASVKLRIF
jgi:hypothetical protein